MADKFDVIKKTLVVVTGASKGIGATIAIELSKLLQNSTFVLFARSEVGLDEIAAQLLTSGNKVLKFSVDLSKPDIDYFEQTFDNISPNFEQKIIFHNAGQVGNLNKTTELSNLNQWQQYYDLNLFSVAILNSVFLNSLPNNTTFIVNISSLCGSVPFSNMSMYCSGKAARNLFFKVLAVEEPVMNILNYSPGPVDTDMVTEVISEMKDTNVRAEFVNLRETSTILKPVETVSRLLAILVDGKYKSGDLIDYFDRDINA